MRYVSALMLVGIAAVQHPFAAKAAETLTYSYDAKGRLVKVVHSGSVNNGTTTTISHDTADNRTNLKVSGASS